MYKKWKKFKKSLEHINYALRQQKHQQNNLQQLVPCLGNVTTGSGGLVQTEDGK